MAEYERPTPLLRLCGIDSLPAPAHQIAGSNVVRSSKEGMPRKGVPEGGREVGREPDFGTQLELSRRPLGGVHSYFAVL